MTHILFDIPKIYGENSYTNYIEKNMSLFLSIEDGKNPILKIKRILSSFTKIYIHDKNCFLDDTHASLHTALSEQFNELINNYTLFSDSYNTAFTLLALALALGEESQIKKAIKICIKEITLFISEAEKKPSTPKSRAEYVQELSFLSQEEWIKKYNPRLNSYIEELLNKEVESAKLSLVNQEERADKAVLRETELRINWLRSNPTLIQNSFDTIKDFSTEYLNEILQPFDRRIMQNAFFTKDISSKYVNVKNGSRKVANFPVGVNAKQARRVIILGSSVTFGWPAEDGHTIASHLQNILKKLAKESFICSSYAINSARLDEFFLQLNALNIQENDIVLFINEAVSYSYTNLPITTILLHLYKVCQDKKAQACYCLFPRIKEILNPSSLEQIFINNGIDEIIKTKLKPNTHIAPVNYEEPTIIQELRTHSCYALDLQPAFNRPHPQGEIYVDANHVSTKGNKLIASYIYTNYFERQIYALQNTPIFPQDFNHESIELALYNTFATTLQKQYAKNESIQNWLNNVKKHSFFTTNKSIGAIVMNCNPFTLGHLFLIETALEKVENLYIFIVEENSSDFDFNTRINLVKQGTAHLNTQSQKVKIFPSGEFIISAITFPEYFQKSSLKTQKVDPSEDIAIFGSIIAKELHITTRFIGEEPLCNVTNQYNQMMKEILPNLGVEICEIPRKEHNSTPISASLVRELLENKNFEELKQLVPATTYNYLIK